MISFECDYNNGVHPEILKRLTETNNDLTPGYGNDKFTEVAKEKIKKVLKNDKAEIFFLVGGTQTNQTVIFSCLDTCEGVIAASTGHINVHEAGAIEFTGHKVITLPQYQGKIMAPMLANYLKTFKDDPTNEHMVYPGMVYISFPTELGTIYTKKELEEIYSICKKYKVMLYIDGARLAYGLESNSCDIKIEDLSNLCDVFYIGGTKCGALCGEAIVFTHGNAPKRFITKIKQNGAMLAKGRLLGIQFDALFTNNLYSKIGKSAIEKAEKLKKAFVDKGYSLFIDSPTNQQFIIMNNKKMKELGENVIFEFWEKYNESQTVVRFVTSWATTEDDIEKLKNLI